MLFFAIGRRAPIPRTGFTRNDCWRLNDMHATRSASVVAALVVCLSLVATSQEAVDLAAVDRIKNEAFARSAVMEHLRNLTDVHGPRLTGSPQFEEAAKWATERLTAYGLSNVHMERWGPFGRSWSVEQYSAELLAPHYTQMVAMPLAWSSSTSGPLTGEPVLAPFDLGFVRGPKRLAEDFEAYRRHWSGKLRGKIVLLTGSKRTRPRDAVLFNRYSDAELADITKAPEPAALQRVTRLDEL